MRATTKRKQSKTGKGKQMKTKTNIKAGKILSNHNQTVARGLKVRTDVRAGRLAGNHNQTLKVKTTLRAGKITYNHNRTLVRR